MAFILYINNYNTFLSRWTRWVKFQEKQPPSFTIQYTRIHTCIQPCKWLLISLYYLYILTTRMWKCKYMKRKKKHSWSTGLRIWIMFNIILYLKKFYTMVKKNLFHTIFFVFLLNNYVTPFRNKKIKCSSGWILIYLSTRYLFNPRI